MKSPSRVPDVKQTLEAFLILAYRHVVAAEHTKALALHDIARKLKIPEALAVKLAVFLESEGLLDYDDQAVDITIPGMLRAEAILRGESGIAGEKAAPAPKCTARTKAS
jgi:hypothetical protein